MKYRSGFLKFILKKIQSSDLYCNISGIIYNLFCVQVLRVQFGTKKLIKVVATGAQHWCDP